MKNDDIHIPLVFILVAAVSCICFAVGVLLAWWVSSR